MSSDEYDLEYRSVADDAWYNALVLLDGHKLTVKLEGFPDCDEFSYAAEFKTLEALNVFIKRFRPISAQIQDDNCSIVTKGKTFCATLVSGDYDIRFYDAVVNDVCQKEHVYNEEEEEVCKCDFMLCWQHGPKKGIATPNYGIQGICQIQSWSKIDHRVATFARIVKNQIRKMHHLPKIKLESTLSHQDCKGAGTVQGPTTGVDNDRDVGGGCFDSSSIKETGNQYFMVIENVEKDISPSLIIEFIKKNTRVSANACVCPSLFFESYARVAVFSDSKEEIDKIFKFLSSSDHIIMSSKGRPWLIYEEKAGRGTILSSFASSIPETQEHEMYESVLKVVKRGEAEFKTGEHLKNLVMEFLEHQRELYASLEERMIYASAP
jgi:hypothetical protein